MAFTGELTGFTKLVTCEDCGQVLPLLVCHSFNGYYVGRQCSNCGPYSRETDYFQSFREAEKELDVIVKKKNSQYQRRP